MTINMYSKNKNIIAFIMFIVIVFSIVSFGYINYHNINILKYNYDNILNSYYLSEEIINLTEEKTRTVILNFRSQKYYRNLVSNFFDLNSDTSFYNKNINKIKNTGVYYNFFIIYNISVFVVIYIHKKDGKI